MYKVGKCLLSELLEKNNMSPQELADRLQISVNQIKEYINNQTIMSLEIALRISTILNCKIEDFYEIIPD